ncbi:hypothetical protein F2Q69_00037813 [Brassica cretica]|uniref:Uncharacterized protein n=1 Tax=Brassica cretica TaxID=69181 RepID=A0A8S9SHI4_BRACR|nr:hypothetical protein F2Q69_00037813 [Brassica cretica]
MRHCRKSSPQLSPPFSVAARPPPEITSAVAARQLSGKSPPVTDTGDSPASRQLGRVDPGKLVGLVKSISGQGLAGLTFDQRVDFSANLDQDVCTGCLCLRSFAGCRDVCTGCHVCGDLRGHRDCLMLELRLHSCETDELE